jgi:N-acetylmuramic acid 6-phosphate etherase
MTGPHATPLGTESIHAGHAALDQYSSIELVQALAGDQQNAVQAVLAAAPDIARAVDAALPRIRAGGRLLYAGAGTSGRLGVLDSVELLPTFGWPSDRAVALIAGGQGAMFLSVEGAEDDTAQGAADLLALSPNAQDVVLLIAASGGTPYVLGALQAARAAGALTIGLANNAGAPVLVQAQIGITLATGPEVVSGSTRLKAGTAQKIALNTFSTSLMVRLNKVYGNLMVDLRASNAKLVKRALRLTMLASGAEEANAKKALSESGMQVKVAVVMLKAGVGVAEAERRLQAAEGSVTLALAAP